MRSDLEATGDPSVDAWVAFKIGAMRGHVGLVKAAIRCFELSEHNVWLLLTSNPPSFFDVIPPR